jgi:hypothetical protein
MGRLRMQTRLIEGTPIYYDPEYEVTEYIYCDRCGSFNIKEFRTAKTWIIMATGLLIAGGLIGVAVLLYTRVSPALDGLVGFALCFITFLVAFDVLALYTINYHHAQHQCRKCGNTSIHVSENELNFKEESRRALDVPDWKAHKHYKRYP